MELDEWGDIIYDMAGTLEEKFLSPERGMTVKLQRTRQDGTLRLPWSPQSTGQARARAGGEGTRDNTSGLETYQSLKYRGKSDPKSRMLDSSATLSLSLSSQARSKC